MNEQGRSIDMTLAAMLVDVAAKPANKATAGIVADYIKDHAPIVALPRRKEVPNWLRLFWCRHAKQHNLPIYGNAAIAHWSAYGVHQALQSVFVATGPNIDHGIGGICGGINVYTSNPYARWEDVEDQAVVLRCEFRLLAVALPDGIYKQRDSFPYARAKTVGVAIFDPAPLELLGSSTEFSTRARTGNSLIFEKKIHT